LGLKIALIIVGIFGVAFAVTGVLTDLPSPAAGGTCGPGKGSETPLEAFFNPASIGAGKEPPTTDAEARLQWLAFVGECQASTDSRVLSTFAITVLGLGLAGLGLALALGGTGGGTSEGADDPGPAAADAGSGGGDPLFPNEPTVSYPNPIYPGASFPTPAYPPPTLPTPAYPPPTQPAPAYPPPPPPPPTTQPAFTQPAVPAPPGYTSPDPASPPSPTENPLI